MSKLEICFELTDIDMIKDKECCIWEVHRKVLDAFINKLEVGEKYAIIVTLPGAGLKKLTYAGERGLDASTLVFCDDTNKAFFLSISHIININLKRKSISHRGFMWC